MLTTRAPDVAAAPSGLRLCCAAPGTRSAFHSPSARVRASEGLGAAGARRAAA
jgi:hypothetical protein